MIISQTHWEGERFSVDPFAFYRLTFRSTAATPGYWFVRFFEETGTEINADLYSRVYPSTAWSLHESCFMARAEARTASYGFRQDKGDLTVEDAAIAAIQSSAALRWMDDLYRDLPPAHARPGSGRFSHLPRTLSKLRGGGHLRLLILGDSIANDTANSLFPLLVERAAPRLKIALIHSVKGGAGCWFYEQDTELERYVLRHKPDLVIIAGISHRNKSDAILNVINKTRLALPEVEFLVINDAVHRSEPAPDSQELEFRNRIEEARNAGRFAFLDMWSEWERYLASCARPFEWYLRDNIHFNDRGKQIIGRIMASFFEPKERT